MRALVVWCPDWPVVAAADEAGVPARLPAAVLAANVVLACNGSARSLGVRRGMRRRDAQSRCPELAVLAANPDRDARSFEAVLAMLEALRPGVAPIRPGLVAIRSPGLYYGGEDRAAAVIAEQLVELGVDDCRLGVADELFTAEQAARQAPPQESLVVPRGESAAFLRGLPVEALDDPDAVSLLQRLGVRTLGQLADLPGRDVRARFGRQTAWVHRVLSGDGATLLAERTPPPDLVCQVDFEPPLDSADRICFSARQTADRFVTGLAQHGLVCTSVRIEAEVEGGTSDGEPASARTWLHPRWFGSTDLVDRLHWQLLGGFRAGQVRAPVSQVRFTPEIAVPDAVHADGLWGGTDERVERGVARVQGVLGHEAVVVPVLQGGRAPAARQAFVPWGERPVGLRPSGASAPPWPGHIPPPAPVRVFADPWAAMVLGRDGNAVVIDDRGSVSSEPHRFRPSEAERWQPVAAWAGPWPVDELWWESNGSRVARFQVVGTDGRAWLMTCADRVWWTEAAYD